jgi:hypothetical protein
MKVRRRDCQFVRPAAGRWNSRTWCHVASGQELQTSQKQDSRRSAGHQLAAAIFTGKQRKSSMTEIKEHMEVIGADGVHVGTVDKVEGNRIKLTRKDSGEGSHKGHHHYIDRGLVADVEGNKVRLSAIGAVAVTMEEEK